MAIKSPWQWGSEASKVSDSICIETCYDVVCTYESSSEKSTICIKGEFELPPTAAQGQLIFMDGSYYIYSDKEWVRLEISDNRNHIVLGFDDKYQFVGSENVAIGCSAKYTDSTGPK